MGHRYDVVGGKVLYCSSTRVGAFKEVLADFRPAASSRDYDAVAGEHLMKVGSVPASWRERRAIAEFSLENPLPFLDVEQDETLTFLTGAMSVDLASLGIERLDSSLIRGPSRLLTRAVAHWAYTQVDDNDEAVYSGIRYSSRFQSHECWAVFAGVDVGAVSAAPIGREDRDLQAVANAFGLTVH